MQVKGTGIKTTRDFVKTKYPDRYNEWVNSLSADSRGIYINSFNISDWYDIKPAYYQPIEKITELFYQNNKQKAGEDLGRYSAEFALKGIYKVFLLVASPQYLMKRSIAMMQAFYNPSEIEVTEKAPNMIVMKINKFEGICKTTEYRIAGWCARALELCNCKNVSYKFVSNLSRGNDATVIEFKWE